MILLEAYPPDISFSDLMFNILFFSLGIFIYLRRDNEQIRPVWKILKLFLLILFGTLLWGYLRDKFNRKL
jgi:hypothetical protein